MNQTHVHLLITHLPIMGSILGSIVMLQAILKKSEDTKIAAYTLFILSSIGAGISYLTGEEAEETAEHLAGVSEDAIHEHEEFAEIALIALIALGLISLIGFFLSKRRSALSGRISTITLIVSLISFGLVAYTGLLGGKIRHTEVYQEQPQENAEEKEHDHDEH